MASSSKVTSSDKMATPKPNTPAKTPATTPPKSPATSPAPTPLIHKRKRKDSVFVQTKRPKPSSPKDSPFALEYQIEEQKARDQVNLRPDDLEGIIVPSHSRPTSSKAAWKGSKLVVDDSKARRWANLNKDKARVQQKKHLNKKELAELKPFPKEDSHTIFKKKEGATAKKDKTADRAKFFTAVENRLSNARKMIVREKGVSEGDREGMKLERMEFRYKCWKRIKCAAYLTGARVDDVDVTKFSLNITTTWRDARNVKYLVPEFTKNSEDRLEVKWEWIPT